ncbi:ABC transporter substrate-binding protein [Halarchaeum salinum]|uniref:Solute-binding protein family 5 domain-containing protein n=1 Tax=Halarchaeum salinum TaxID=489912 RepID=A0AAV3SAG7_9EURY
MVERGDLTRRRFLAAGAGAASFSLAGCFGDAGPAPAATFTLGTSGSFAGLNPLTTASAQSWILLDLVYESGTVVDPVTFDVRPNVFTDWRLAGADDDAAGLAIDVAVRDGLTFTDGTPLTADDVRFTYRYLREQRPARYLPVVSTITAVTDAPGGWDVRLHLSEPVGTYASSTLALPILPEHVWRDVADYRRYRPSEHGGPVGLGPASVTSYDPDTSASLAFRDPDAYALSSLDWLRDHDVLDAGGPFLDELRVQVYGSDAALQRAFLDGEVDSVFRTAAASAIPDVEAAAGKTLVEGSATGFGFYGFNLRRAPLDDLVFRQTLAFAFDDYHYVTELHDGYVRAGDFVVPPEYTAVRPETAAGADADVLTDPATEAYAYRARDDGAALDVAAVRDFLTGGEPITGPAGTYAGREYPGSLTGAHASQRGARHDYTFGPVRSDALADADTDRELRVDGRTIPDIMGGPLDILITPASSSPERSAMTTDWIETLGRLGIPATRTVLSLGAMVDTVYAREEFDVYPVSIGGVSPFAVTTLYSLFHGDSADAAGDDTVRANNAMGYGLFEHASADGLIERALRETDTARRNALARRAVERIYLDAPVMVTDYPRPRWPLDTDAWTNYVSNIPAPGSTNLATELTQLRPRR